MRETMFLPPASLRPRIAPTEINPATGQPLRGEVHDDTARYMGGVTGNAGVFTTAGDLAKFAQMMLDEGQGNGVRLFSAATVQKFTIAAIPARPADFARPGLGHRFTLFEQSRRIVSDWFLRPHRIHRHFAVDRSVQPHLRHHLDQRSASSPRTFDRFAAQPRSYHRGRIVRDSRPSVKLTGYNETIVGPGLHREVEPKAEVLTGLDVLAEDNFAALRGKRIGLITNQTGVSREGRRNVDLMLSAGVQVTALFSPEHGLAGAEDRSDISDTKDPASGLPVFSLYQASSRRIQPAMLDNVDALVFDIQDVGARFYTYSCTMLYSMEEAAKKHLPFFVLDRPNPITGVHAEGPLLDPDLQSFTGCFEIPVRHGMTHGRIGEHGEWRAETGPGSARDSHAGLGSGRLVRRYRPSLGGSVTQYAEPQRGATYIRESRCWKRLRIIRWAAEPIALLS